MANDPTSATSQGFDHFLQETVVYGLAYVFLVAVCFAILVVIGAATWAVVRLIWKGPAVLTHWINTDITTKKAVAQSANALTTSLGPIGVSVTETRIGLHHVVKAADAHVTRNPEQFDADVLAHLKNARDALKAT